MYNSVPTFNEAFVKKRFFKFTDVRDGVTELSE